MPIVNFVIFMFFTAFFAYCVSAIVPPSVCVKYTQKQKKNKYGDHKSWCTDDDSYFGFMREFLFLLF